MKTIRIAAIALGFSAALATGAAHAQGEPRDLPVLGVPWNGGMDFQTPVTDLASRVQWLDSAVHIVLGLILLLVTVLLAIVILRFNKRANPTPAVFTHNTKIEIAWTLIPVIVLIVLGSFSLPILFEQLEVPESDLTIKATGNQWYWSYDYPDNEFAFDALMLAEDELAEYGYTPDVHQLATDNAVVVPVDAVVKLQTTGGDVIHSWALPAFGVKMDAIPGRLNEIWFQPTEEGVFFGQCSELCGKDHSYMPITVKVVSAEQYDAWLDWAIEEYGGTRGEADVAMAD